MAEYPQMQIVSFKLSLAFFTISGFTSPLFAAIIVQSHSAAYHANGIIIKALDKSILEELRSEGIPEGVLAKATSLVDLCISVRNMANKSISDLNIQYEKVPSEVGQDSVFESFMIPLTATRRPGRGLQPAGRVLLCPLPELNEAIFRKMSMAPSSEQRLNAAQLEFSSSRYSKVIVSVDSAVMDDGLVYGPDRLDVIGKAADIYRGKMTVMREFVNRGGADATEIRKWLDGIKDDFGMYDHRVGRPDFYKQGTAMGARDILFLFDKMPKANVLPAIQMQLANPPPPHQPHR